MKITFGPRPGISLPGPGIPQCKPLQTFLVCRALSMGKADDCLSLVIGILSASHATLNSVYSFDEGQARGPAAKGAGERLGPASAS